MNINRVAILLISSLLCMPLYARTDIVSYGDFVFNVINKEYAEVKNIKDKEFVGEVVVPDSVYVEQFDKIMPVKAIGTEAFSDCVNMTTCVMPVGIESIGQSAFSGCANMTSCVIPIGIESISQSTFSGCVNMTECTMPVGLKSIGQLAFNNCKNLKSVVIPNSVTTIQKGAFMDSGLNDIDLPQSITDIEREAFANCPDLKAIDLSECNIEYLYPIFGGSTVLESVVLPECLTILEDYVFLNMQLKTIDFPESLKTIGFSLYNNPVKQINIKHIKQVYASFWNCKQLTEVEWSDQPGARYDYEAFNGTSLSEVIIGKNVCSLSHSPFGNIQTLRSVKCFVADPDSIDYGVSNPPLPGEEIDPGAIYSIEVFKGSDLSQCILWVPEGSLELYRNYPMWRDFPDIREMDAAGMPIIKDEQSPAETSCFDLQGRKVTDPQPGNVYIVNGRKLLHQ